MMNLLTAVQAGRTCAGHARGPRLRARLHGRERLWRRRRRPLRVRQRHKPYISAARYCDISAQTITVTLQRTQQLGLQWSRKTYRGARRTCLRACSAATQRLYILRETSFAPQLSVVVLCTASFGLGAANAARAFGVTLALSATLLSLARASVARMRTARC
jgi:hypothetical protein